LAKDYLGVPGAPQSVSIDISNGHAGHGMAIQFSERSLHIGFAGMYGFQECAKVFGFHAG
jgi:hypothetical protein